MPTYAYFCNKCLLPFELTMTLADKDRVDSGKEKIMCPECKKALTNIIAAPKIIRIN